jgi:hypothetical protein
VGWGTDIEGGPSCVVVRTTFRQTIGIVWVSRDWSDGEVFESTARRIERPFVLASAARYQTATQL